MAKKLVTLLAVALIVFFVPPLPCSNSYFFEGGYNPDAFEYFMPAANFALHNKFPYYGFMSNMNSYHIHRAPESVKYFADTYKAGSIVFVSKPPLYSLLLGVCFKLFGFNVCTAATLNYVLLIVTVISMLFAAYIMGKYTGVLLLIPITLVYAKSFLPDVWNTDAEMLSAALTALSFVAGTWAFKNFNRSRIILAGVAMALLLLCKGYFVFTMLCVLLFLMWLFIKSKNTKYLQALVYFSVGVWVPLICWMAYINPLLKSDITNRLAFAEKLEATTPQISVENRAQLFAPNGVPLAEAIENLNKFHQYQHARENGFVFISNQIGKYNILNVHNEFCTDGDFHPEWRLVNSSFYYSCLHDPNYLKLLKFYSNFPIVGMQITWAKLTYNKNVSVWLFYSVFLLLAFLFFVGRLPVIYVPPHFMLATVFIILIAFYGDVRFIYTILPVTCVILGMALMKAIRFLLTARY